MSIDFSELKKILLTQLSDLKMKRSTIVKSFKDKLKEKKIEKIKNSIQNHG